MLKYWSISLLVFLSNFAILIRFLKSLSVSSHRHWE
nr:MAG TPA: hypothetical protein [Caudoviricetes sp.]